MAQAGRRNQDQNFSVHFDGAPIAVKSNGSTVQRKGGGIRGRKALNDISNSGKPSAVKASGKPNLTNVIPIGVDLSASKKTQAPVGSKSISISNRQEKAQVGGRKALGDLTNSVKPFGLQQDMKKPSKGKKLISLAEEDLPNPMAEGFLHNHQECVKSHWRALEMHQFLKTIGLDEDVSMQSSRTSKVDESPKKLVEMVELSSELPVSGQSSPVCGSPKSPRLSYMNNDYDNFILAETPRLPK